MWIKGVYQIRVGKVYYIGRSANIEGRVMAHQADLNAGRHKCKNLQEAYNDIGLLEWDVLELVQDDLRLNIAERFWQNYQQSTGKLIACRVLKLLPIKRI